MFNLADKMRNPEKDPLDKHKPDNIDELKEQAIAAVSGQMMQAAETGANSKANAGSPEQLMDILLGQLQIPTDKLSDDQRKTILDVI